MRNIIGTCVAAGSAAFLAFGTTLYFTQGKTASALATTPAIAASSAPTAVALAESMPVEQAIVKGSVYDRIPAEGLIFAENLPDRDDIKLSIFSSRERTKRRVLDQLTDPDSAKFMRVAATRFEQGSSVVMFCGFVNSKNGFGGYGQPMRFYGIDRSTMIDDGNEAFQLGWTRYCDDAEMVAVVENF